MHPRLSSHGISLVDLAKQINMFRKGIAEMQQQLHLLFRTPIPAAIINASYMPNVVVVEETERD